MKSPKGPRDHQKPVSIVMVAIGGYGYYYLKTLFEEFPPGKVSVKGVVDPDPKSSQIYPTLQKHHIPAFSSLGDFYSSGKTADLAIIASPIHYHVEQSCEALQQGSHVLCEKPVAATVQEVDRLITVRDQTHRRVIIGYQWSFSESIKKLKRDILKGLFGKPVRFKTLYLWPRDSAYYNRNNWAGKKKSKDGRWILDSPASSAMAHDLHNLFYLLGDKTEASALPAHVTAEAYRANPIENYDTTACRIRTEDDVEILFYGSHAVPEKQGPFFSLEFEDALITFDGTGDIIARNKNGLEKCYRSPFESHQFTKLFHAVDSVRQPLSVICGPEAGRSQVVCMNGIQESMGEAVPFPDSIVVLDRKKKLRWVQGLTQLFQQCYEKAILPCETGTSWTRGGRPVKMQNYRMFRGI